MSGSAARLQAIEAVTTYKPTSEPLSFSNVSASEIFGSNVFGRSAMQARLPKPVYQSLMRTIDTGSSLDLLTSVFRVGALHWFSAPPQ
jgi:glutamine synthetase